MYNIKILENAVTAAIELSESCTSDSRSDCRDIYHIAKFVRASVRDCPQITDKAMFDTLGMHAARLRKIAGGKITGHVIVSDIGEIFSLPITNTYSSLAHFIRRSGGNCLRKTSKIFCACTISQNFLCTDFPSIRT